MKHELKDIQFLVKLAQEHGYVAFIHPRKKTVNISGGRELSYKDAYHKLVSLTLPF